jgi:hypothetical protein
MTETINEKVSVITIFKQSPLKNEVIPYLVKWQGRKYKIKKIGFQHSIREGRNVYHIFTVSTENIDMRLKFDTQNMHWILEEITDGFTN